MGDCRADVSKVVDGGRAAILLTPNVGVTGSGSLLHSSIATLLKKCSSDFLEVEIKYHTHEKKGTGLSTFLFLGIGDMVALDCNLNHCYSLYVPFKFQVLCLKNEQCLLSSASYIITAFPLASGHPGLEIKILYYVLCTVLYSKVHKSTATCGGCVHVTMFARHVN